MLDKFDDWYEYIDEFVLGFRLSALYKPVRLVFANTHARKFLDFDDNSFYKINPAELFIADENDIDYKIIHIHFEENSFDTILKTRRGLQYTIRARSKLLRKDNNLYGIILGRDINVISQLEDEVAFLNEELINQKENFEALIDNLTQTQEQLVQSEKMAALGQLIAGVAHEINTPLGAIKASIGNLTGSLDNLNLQLPKMLLEMSEKEKQLLLFLIHNTGVDLKLSTAKEDRRMKREVARYLHEKKIKNADYIADTIALLELNEHKDEIYELIKDIDSKSIFELARSLNSLYKNKQTIHIAVEKAAKVVFALKKFAHHDQSGEKIPSDIVDGIETVLTLYNNQIKHGIKVERNMEQLRPVSCYFDEINQVWTNLIHNSIQAMGQSGTLTIETKQFDDYIEVIIGDTGYGIPPEVGTKMFEPFFTTKKQGEGSGLGLDIVKNIIEKHNGSISYESEVNVGTKFFVKIPIN